VGASSLDDLAFDQAQRALNRQQQSVADLPARMGAVIAVAGLIGALLVAPAVRAKPSSSCATASAACLAGGVLRPPSCPAGLAGSVRR